MNRDWNDGVSYDHETKTIVVDYHSDDLMPFCSCSGEVDEDEGKLSYLITGKEGGDQVLSLNKEILVFE